MAGGQLTTCFAHINEVQDKITSAKDVKDQLDDSAKEETLIHVMGRLLADAVDKESAGEKG